MKTIHKRATAAAAALALSMGLQWLSGVPFQRSPLEALIAAYAIVFAVLCVLYVEIGK